MAKNIGETLRYGLAATATIGLLGAATHAAGELYLPNQTLGIIAESTPQPSNETEISVQNETIEEKKKRELLEEIARKTLEYWLGLFDQTGPLTIRTSNLDEWNKGENPISGVNTNTLTVYWDGNKIKTIPEGVTAIRYSGKLSITDVKVMATESLLTKEETDQGATGKWQGSVVFKRSAAAIFQTAGRKKYQDIADWLMSDPSLPEESDPVADVWSLPFLAKDGTIKPQNTTNKYIPFSAELVKDLINGMELPSNAWWYYADKCAKGAQTGCRIVSS